MMKYPSCFHLLSTGSLEILEMVQTEISTSTPLEWKLRLFAVGMGLDLIIGVGTK